MRVFSALAFLGLLLVTPSWGAAAGFQSTGKLNGARYDHTATLLLDGKVLVVGGLDYPADMTTTAELYDPSTTSWAYTATARGLRWTHTATLLPDGRVLVVGGQIGLISRTDTAELYDPTSETWSTTGRLHRGRLGHTATLLVNGQVLVCGGFELDPYQGLMPLAEAELYDPATGIWTRTGKMTTARGGSTATLLENGQVLAVGGRDSAGLLDTAELYDPATGAWTATGSMRAARQFHSATLLPGGQVLVAGGDAADGANAELYEPVNESWAATGSLRIGRSSHTATLLPDGTVLVAGGSNPQGSLASAELYQPANGIWATTGRLGKARTAQTATLLPDNTVLIAGGHREIGSYAPALASAELFVRPPALQNISTRLAVGSGDDVLIGGFIITGSGPQPVIVRGIGPSMALAGTLADPVIELHDSSGALIASNDNWKDDPNQQNVVENGLAPTSNAESALWQTLDPGAYTVILKGKNDGSGVGLVEVYELGEGSGAKLANIATRGLVQTGDNVLIGGLIVGQGSGVDSTTVYLRALGPSLPVPNALSDPNLELHDGNGTLIDSNDNWKSRPDGSSQQAEIETTTITPSDDLESALLETLPPGNYTAIVRGKTTHSGVGMVEVYNLP